MPILDHLLDFTFSHPISFKSVLILSSYLRRGHPSAFFLTCFLTKIVYVLSSLSMSHLLFVCLCSFDQPHNIKTDSKSWIPSSCNFPVSCDFVALRTKYVSDLAFWQRTDTHTHTHLTSLQKGSASHANGNKNISRGSWCNVWLQRVKWRKWDGRDM